MRNLFIIASFALFGLCAYAQTAKVTGKITDNQNVPVDLAGILLVQNDSVCYYEMTDENGNFAVNAKRGDYHLYVKQFSDTLYQQQLTLTNDVDLQTIIVAQGKELQDVTVVAKKKLIERRVDRTVFNVENLPSVEGGDVMDILRITPTLIVTSDKIAIVGKGSVNVLIDDRFIKLSGEELTVFLKSLRADEVQSIEVITTPPAKYEAEGNSGLINIVMKKTPQNTWKSSLFSSYIQDKNGYGNIGGGFNYRKNKLSFYTNISYGGGKSYARDDTKIYYPDLNWHTVGNYNYNTKYSAGVRAGFDVDITDNWTVGAVYMGSFRNSKTASNTHTDILTKDDNSIAALVDSKGDSKGNSNTNSANIHSIITLDSLGRKLNIDFDILNYKTNSNDNYSSTTSASQVAAIPNNYEDLRQNLDRKITNYSAKIDMEHPFKAFNLSYGVKLSFTRTNNNIVTHDLSSGIAVLNPQQTNNFLYRENTQAIYLSGSAGFGKNKQWQLQIGLRGENTQWEGRSVTMDSVNKSSYFQIFPTAYLSFNPSEKHVLSLEYGRRINRPGFDELNPFRWYSNPYYYLEGNPELKPSISNNIVLQYVFDGVLSIALFGDYQTENRSTVITMDSVDYVQAVKRLNFYNSYDVGLGVGYEFNKLKWWLGQIGMNLWFVHSDSKIYPVTPKSQEGYGTQFLTYNNFYIDKNQNFSAGFFFSYSPPTEESMVYDYTKFTLNAFVKMLFLEKQLSVTLTGNNLLNEYDFNNRRQSYDNLIFSKGLYSPLNVRLAVSYTFGSKKINDQQHQISNEDEKNRL